MDLSELFGVQAACLPPTTDERAHAFDLSFLFSDQEKRSPPPSACEVVAPLPPSLAVRPSERYNGYANSMTWGVALMLSNSNQHYQSIQRLIRLDGSLPPEALQAYVNGLSGQHALELDTWMEGDVDWAEIAAEFVVDLPHGVATDLRQHIALARIEGNLVQLVEQLDRATYQKVNAILESLGGKWDRKRKGHVFTDEPNEVIDTFLLTGRFPGGVEDPKKTFGFFPTPEALAAYVVGLAKLGSGMTVLEPSAGSGRLAAKAAAVVGKAAVRCVEIQPRLANDLRTAGYSVVEADFLSMAPCDAERVERIVMNPPFRARADIHHVMHAAQWLQPGGRLVAIMSEGVTYRSSKLDTEFQAFVQAHNGVFHRNPEGAFKESGTMVNTVTLVLDKPF